MVAMADQVRESKLSWLIRRRVWVQSFFLLLWLDPFMLRLHSVCGPVFHCYSCPLAVVACPIGILANFSALHLFPFLAVGTLLVVASLLGSAICGWACPFGLLQDLIGRLPLPKLKLPTWAGYPRYAVLIAMVIVIPYLYGDEHPLFFCLLCPAGALEGAVPNAIKSAGTETGLVLPSLQKMIILGGILLAMFFTLRPWCTVFCPLGAIFSLFNKASILTLRFSRQGCRECGACDKMCRYDVLPAVDVNNAECIRCLECTRCQAIDVGTVFGQPSDRREAAEMT
jgi:polyferredoxin